MTFNHMERDCQQPEKRDLTKVHVVQQKSKGKPTAHPCGQVGNGVWANFILGKLDKIVMGNRILIQRKRM